MNRRQLLAGAAGAAVVAAAPAVQAAEPTLEDKYWNAQWLIGELEQERSDMRNHRAAMRANVE